MTPWHQEWQAACVARGWEIESLRIDADGEFHWADATSPKGQVIEFQHSAIDRSEIDSRGVAHRWPLWIVDATHLEVPAAADPATTTATVVWPACPSWVLTIMQQAGRAILDTRDALVGVGPPTGSPAGAVFTGVVISVADTRQDMLLALVERCDPSRADIDYLRLILCCPRQWLGPLLAADVTPHEARLWLDGTGTLAGLWEVHQRCLSRGLAAPHPDRKDRYTGHYGSWLDRLAAGKARGETVEGWFAYYSAHAHLISHGVPPAIASLWKLRDPDIAIVAQAHCAAYGTTLHDVSRTNKPAMDALKAIDTEQRRGSRTFPNVPIDRAAIKLSVERWSDDWLIRHVTASARQKRTIRDIPPTV
jgi:hypothetical protein